MASTHHPPTTPSPSQESERESCVLVTGAGGPHTRKGGKRGQGGYLVCPGLGALARHMSEAPDPGLVGWGDQWGGRVPARMKHSTLSSPGGGCTKPPFTDAQGGGMTHQSSTVNQASLVAPTAQSSHHLPCLGAQPLTLRGCSEKNTSTFF